MQKQATYNIREYFLCLLMLFGLYMPIVSQAEDLQKFDVQNNGELIVTIAQKELSRFVFKKANNEPDNIKQVIGINGEFYQEIQDNNLYIRPGVLKPINFFVRTEQGNIYKLLATIKDVPAIQILIQEKVGSQHPHKSKSSSLLSTVSESSYLKHEISKIVKVIRAQDRSMGYDIKEIGKKVSNKQGLNQEHLLQWSNEDIVADEFILHNDSAKSVEVLKDHYLADGIQAVYADKIKLQPNEHTRMITVKSIR